MRHKISKAQQLKKEDPSKKGGNPTKRILIEAQISKIEWQRVIRGNTSFSSISDDELNRNDAIFRIQNIDDAKERTVRSISIRRGQKKFRDRLLKAYEGQCAISGTRIPEILEAAHIMPYQGAETNHPTNGIILRSDIHTLFDLGLIGINSVYQVLVSKRLRNSEYGAYHGNTIFVPKSLNVRPSMEALNSRALPNY